MIVWRIVLGKLWEILSAALVIVFVHNYMHPNIGSAWKKNG